MKLKKAKSKFHFTRSFNNDCGINLTHINVFPCDNGTERQPRNPVYYTF